MSVLRRRDGTRDGWTDRTSNESRGKGHQESHPCKGQVSRPECQLSRGPTNRLYRLKHQAPTDFVNLQALAVVVLKRLAERP